MLIFLPLLLIAIDQGTKWWVTLTMERGEAGSTTLINNVLDLTYIRNYGAAMGMLEDHRWIFLALSTLTIVGLIALLIFAYEKFSYLTKIAWVMILAGGIGNMIDRTFYGESLFNGGVIDFIHVRLFNDFFPWIFNFADIFIFFGVALFMFSVVRDEVKLAKRTRAETREKMILTVASGELLDIEEDEISEIDISDTTESIESVDESASEEVADDITVVEPTDEVASCCQTEEVAQDNSEAEASPSPQDEPTDAE